MKGMMTESQFTFAGGWGGPGACRRPAALPWLPEPLSVSLVTPAAAANTAGVRRDGGQPVTAPNTRWEMLPPQVLPEDAAFYFLGGSSISALAPSTSPAL